LVFGQIKIKATAKAIKRRFFVVKNDFLFKKESYFRGVPYTMRLLRAYRGNVFFLALYGDRAGIMHAS